MHMLLKKEILTEDDAKLFFPIQNLTNENGYQHYIQVYAATPMNKKTFTQVIIDVVAERKLENYTMTCICMNVPRGTSLLDKPLRKTAREEIYKQAKQKLLDKALKLLPSNHPYVKTLEAM